jgi:hypothetical protein
VATKGKDAKPIDPSAAISLLEGKTPKDWAKLSAEVGLTAEQSREMALILRHLLHDMRDRAGNTTARETRAHLIARLKTLARHTHALDYEVRRAKADLETALPWSVRYAVTRLIRRSAMEAAAGGALPVWMAGQDVDSLSEINEEALAITCGVAFLAHIVAAIDEPLQEWIEINGLNRGGKPANEERLRLLVRLARFFEQVRGRRPTGTTRGDFKKFCSSVFQFLDLDETGLEEAIDEIVAAYNKRERSHG